MPSPDDFIVIYALLSAVQLVCLSLLLLVCPRFVIEEFSRCRVNGNQALAVERDHRGRFVLVCVDGSRNSLHGIEKSADWLASD